MLNVSYQYVDQLCREEKIPYQQTGSGKIFLFEDIEKFQRERIRKSAKDKRVRVKKVR